MSDDRKAREDSTRAEEAREESWTRPSALPVPKPKPGIKYRWIRTSTLGQADTRNVSTRFREGYVPVLAKDHPEFKVLADLDSRFPENIEVGGLLLCAIKSDKAEKREKAQLDHAQAQIEAVDRNYLRQSDPRMPVLQPERRTTTGSGS